MEGKMILSTSNNLIYLGLNSLNKKIVLKSWTMYAVPDRWAQTLHFIVKIVTSCNMQAKLDTITYLQHLYQSDGQADRVDHLPHVYFYTLYY